MTMGGGSNFDPIGVRLVVIGQREYEEALRRAQQSGQRLAQSARQQQSGFSGLNPHMRTSVFYTQQLGAGFITLRGGTGLLALAISTLASSLSDALQVAVKFESQMAQVRQVTGQSRETFATTEEDVRKLALALPFTTEEIAKVVTEAARAGVEGRQQLLSFTKAMLDFATISGIAAEQATLDFAHLALAFQHPKDRVAELTSAVAALDKEFPTSSREIVNFSLRIAAAGKVTGFTAGQIFGIATAMTSLGIRAEAGGTAVQRVFFAIAGAVKEGGESLADFAKVSGLSAAEFARLWKGTSAETAEAFIRFTEGLGRAGDQAQAALKGLELGDVRLIRAFATTAGAGDLLRRSVQLGADAMGQSTLAAERAAIVYETTESQVKRLENAFRDNAIEVGKALLPAYRDILTLLNGMAVRGAEFARILSGSVIPQLIATARVTAGYLSPSLKLSATFTQDLADSFVRMGIAAQSSLISAVSGVQHLAGNLARASNTATFLALEAERQQLVRQREAAQATADLPGQQNRERHLAEVARLSAEITRTTDAMAASVARETEIVNFQNKALAQNLYIFQQLEFVRSQATKRSDEERRVRETFNAIEADSVAAVTSEIAVRQQAIATYKAEREAIEQEIGSTDRLTTEIVLQEGVVAQLQERLRELRKLGSLGQVPGGGLDLTGLGDDGKDAAKALRDWKREFDEMVKGLQSELIPTLRTAVAIIGEDFTGTVQRAAIVTTASLTDAMLKQAAIIGGPYGAALIAVAQHIANITGAVGGLEDAQDGQFQSAENLIASLQQTAESLLALSQAGADTTASVAQAQATIDRLRTLFQRLPDNQRKATDAILDNAQSLLNQAAAAKDNDDALKVYLEGLKAIIGAAKDYADAVDEMTAADKRRADASKTAAEKLAEAMAAESKANDNLTKQNDRLVAAQKALADARKSGDPVAIRAAALEAALAKEAVNRAKERVRGRREETKEAEVDVAETGVAKGGEKSAADLRREELDEAAARKRRENRLLPAAERRKLAALQQPEFIGGTVPLRLSSIPGVSSIPLRPAAFAGGNVDSSRSVVVNASYVNQPEVEVKHDLQALSMMGLV